MQLANEAIDMLNGSFEGGLSQVHLAMAAVPESTRKSSQQSDPGLCRLNALSEDNPCADPLNRRNYANGMAELQRQWPLSSGPLQSDLLKRAEQMNRNARASTASSSKASPVKEMVTLAESFSKALSVYPSKTSTVKSPDGTKKHPTDEWIDSGAAFVDKSEDEIDLMLHGAYDTKRGVWLECEVFDSDSD